MICVHQIRFCATECVTLDGGGPPPAIATGWVGLSGCSVAYVCWVWYVG